jgi:hypothetical protein
MREEAGAGADAARTELAKSVDADKDDPSAPSSSKELEAAYSELDRILELERAGKEVAAQLEQLFASDPGADPARTEAAMRELEEKMEGGSLSTAELVELIASWWRSTATAAKPSRQSERWPRTPRSSSLTRMARRTSLREWTTAAFGLSPTGTRPRRSVSATSPRASAKPASSCPPCCRTCSRPTGRPLRRSSPRSGPSTPLGTHSPGASLRSGSSWTQLHAWTIG